MSYGYKKGYNPQKYAENRKAEKERTYQMIDDTAIEVSRSPDKLKEFLAVQAKFGISPTTISTGEAFTKFLRVCFKSSVF